MIYDPHKLGMDRIIEDQQLDQAEREREAAEQRRKDRESRESAKREKADGNIDDASIGDSPAEFASGLAGLIALAIWIAVSYYGITNMPQLGFWPIGIGFVTAFIVAQQLKGPLKIMLAWPKWILIPGVLGVVIYLIIESQKMP